jgi:hypothetical protein
MIKPCPTCNQSHDPANECREAGSYRGAYTNLADVFRACLAMTSGVTANTNFGICSVCRREQVGQRHEHASE